jgi:hypothetical protein
LESSLEAKRQPRRAERAQGAEERCLIKNTNRIFAETAARRSLFLESLRRCLLLAQSGHCKSSPSQHKLRLMIGPTGSSDVRFWG